MRLVKFDFKAAKDFGGLGIPTSPIIHTRTTAAMKIAFHLRLELMAWIGSGLHGCGLYLLLLTQEGQPARF
jgi:hypothetical protein